MNPYYELHITIQTPKYTEYRVKGIVETFPGKQKWTFSAIDGDLVLGDEVKCYATTHVNTRVGAFVVGQILEEMSAYIKMLLYGDMKILRKKIELVVYDALAGRDFEIPEPVVEEEVAEEHVQDPVWLPPSDKTPDDIPF